MSNSTQIQSEATECSTSVQESSANNKVTDSDGFFDKLAACLPPEEFNATQAVSNYLEKSDIKKESNDNKNAESLSDIIDTPQNFQETSIQSEKTHKSELELLKEKIMKLEQRNNELEKKLTTNISSKENSLNDSFNIVNNSNIEESFKNKNNSDSQAIANGNISGSVNGSNSASTQMYVASTSETKPSQNTTTNLVINGLNKSQINSSTSNNSSLKNIPNINQGGFIITSTGSIAYVPPSRGTNSTSTPIAQKPTSSSYASSSVNGASQVSINDLMSSPFVSKKAIEKNPNSNPNNSNAVSEDSIKLDFDSLANNSNKNSISLDLSSFLKCNQNIFNLNSTLKSSIGSPSTSPQKSNDSNKKSDIQHPTAFILSSSGQLVPMNNTKTNNTTHILPKPQLLPKPSTSSASTVDLKLLKKNTKAKSSKKQKLSEATDKVEIITHSISTPTIAPITNDSTPNNLKHRAIRPKPASNTNHTVQHPVQHKNIQPKPIVSTIAVKSSTSQQVLVLPNGALTTSPTSNSLGNTSTNLNKNFGLIKINTLSPAKDKSAIVSEANDILSKAASMIFSPSEFTLNNLSPSNNVSTMSASPNNSHVLIQSIENQANSSDKIAIQRNHNQQNVLSKSIDSNLLKPAKIAIPKNPKATHIVKQPEPVQTLSINKIAIAPNKSNKKTSTTSISAKMLEATPESSTTQRIILNGINLTVQQQPFSQDTFTNICSFGSMSNNNTSSSLSAEQKQQDLEIQLQLQSIMNGTANAPANDKKSLEEKSSDKDFKTNDISLIVNSNPIENCLLKSQADRSTAEVIESMPSLDDFFSIGPESEKTTSPPKPGPKSSKTNKSRTDAVKLIDNEVTTGKSSDKKTILPKKSPISGSKKNIEIRPKASTECNSKQKTIKPKESLKEIKQSDKLKFELSDLDKVLQQVESIASFTNTVKESESINESTSSKVDNQDDFMLDLLNIENSSPTVEGQPNNVDNVSHKTQIKTPTMSVKPKKTTFLKKIDKSASVLSTPPSLLSNNKSKKSKSTRNTPIKSQQQMPVGTNLLDDNDFFSFLKETGDELKRVPLKPDNHIQEQVLTKKRGRPPKPSVKASDKLLEEAEFDANDNSTPKKKCQDDSEIETNGDTNSSTSESKCILNAAVENTFQDLINSKNETLDNLILNGKSQREKSCENTLSSSNSQNNKENTELNIDNMDELNNFVYDIADNSNAQNTSMVAEDTSTDITIASLMSNPKSLRKRGRGSHFKQTSELKSKISTELQEVTKEQMQSAKENTETEEEDCSKRRKHSTSEINENELLVELNSNINESSTVDCNFISEDKTTEPTIAALAASLPCGEKRKRGRPKQASSQKTEENKPLNYKKINNPCGTTSLLALKTPPPNIEYAGLTRFEIPFEIEEDTSTNNSSDKVNDKSPNKQANIAENDTKEIKGDDMNLVADNSSSKDVFVEKIQKTVLNFEEDLNKKESDNNNKTSESTIESKEDQKEILDNLYETAAAAVKSFHSENSFEEACSSKDLFNTSSSNINGKTNQIVREPIESNVSSDYWTTSDPLPVDAKKDSLQKKAHIISHYDLENDPIINKDLQQLHSNTNSTPETTSVQHQSKAQLPAHYITNITSQPLITPSPTVCSVPSSVSSNASQFSLNNASINKNGSANNNNNLSINPSSTSSTSSAQMISPVNSEAGIIRSSSNDQTHQYSNLTSNSYYNVGNNQSVQQPQNVQMNSYFNNGFNQYGNSTAKPINKSLTPTKYSNSSYTEANNSSHILDINVSQSHQHQTQQNLNPSTQLPSDNLYRSNSSSNLHVVSNNTKTPLTQSTSQAQLNTSQSPQQRNSLSLCSTPQPPTSKTPQPSTTPSHNYSSNNATSINIANTAFNQNSSRASPINQSANLSQKTSSNSSKPTAIPNMYSNQPSTANMYQQNLFTQNGVMQAAFPLLSNQPRVDMYAPPNFSSQYNQNQQQLNTNQYKPAHPQKSGQYDQATSYMQPTSQPSLQPPQSYYMNHHHQQTANYLPNLLAPSYPSKSENQTSGHVQNQTPFESLQKASKPAKTEKKASTKQAKRNQKTSNATNPSNTGPVGSTGDTSNYTHQNSNNYEKIMSVNAATALQHAAWYDLQAQLGTAQQNNQYNSQFQKSGLNPFFASSTLPSTNAQKSAKVENFQRTNLIQSNQHPNSYQNQYQSNGLNQGSQNYSAKDTNASLMARSSSSSNLDETLYSNRSTANTQHQNTSPNLYNQYHHNLNQHSLANNQHFTNQNMSSQQQSHANTVPNSQFNHQSNAHNQFSHHQKNNSYGVTTAHHHLTNTALAFPHHPHHQAVAMNSLLANQFSNVSPFNWHPKI